MLPFLLLMHIRVAMILGNYADNGSDCFNNQGGRDMLQCRSDPLSYKLFLQKTDPTALVTRRGKHATLCMGHPHAYAALIRIVLKFSTPIIQYIYYNHIISYLSTIKKLSI